MSENTTGEKITLIWHGGDSYYGIEICYDHELKTLMERSYCWHIDDGQEFSGWNNISLEECLNELPYDVKFSTKAETMKLLRDLFGSEEVDNILNNY